MLFLYEDDKLQTSYPVAVGKPTWPTPTGGFQVLRLKKDPVWVVPQSIQEEMQEKGMVVKERVPPGPHNPLGDYWMGLSIPGIGIHATNAPVSIYSYRTHGCIRLQPDNAKDLFDRITPDTPGMILYEPVLFATTHDGKVFLEVDVDIYKNGGTSLDDVRGIADSARIGNLIDWNRAAAVVKNHDGLAHEVGAKK
jgi:L,D-transpeptidase ErfK/SrfK